MAAPGIAFILLALPFVTQPIDTWEWLNLAAGGQILVTGVPSATYPVAAESAGALTAVSTAPPLLIHPPSSAYAIALFQRLLGVAEWQARVPGLLAVVATAYLLVIAARRMTADGQEASARAGLLATCLYLIHPATLQGALYLGFSEGTFLPLSWILFVVTWVTIRRRPLLARAALGGLCLALALWAKITTTLALPMCVAMVAVAIEGPTAGVALATGVTGLGVVLFAGSWWAYVAYLSTLVALPAGRLWGEPLRYLVSEAQAWPSPAEVVINGLRVFLFLGPVTVVAAGLAVARRVRECIDEGRARREDLVPLLTLAILLGYLVLPGGTGSFPKYHLVILPFLALLAARELGRGPSLGLRHMAILFGAGVAYHVWVVGDLLKLLNHDLRQAEMLGRPGPVGLRIGVAAILYAVLPLAIRPLARSWRAAFLVAALASQLALILLQAHGGYFAKHSYGTPVADLTRAVELVRAETSPGSAILALPEIGYQTQHRIVRGMTRLTWNDPPRLAEIISVERPSAVVYGLPTHTIGQMRALLSDPVITASLQLGYRRIDVGEFTVWLRNF